MRASADESTPLSLSRKWQAANKKIKELTERNQAAEPVLKVDEVHRAIPVPNVKDKIVEKYM